jgi:hypothetical protein
VWPLAWIGGVRKNIKLQRMNTLYIYKNEYGTKFVGRGIITLTREDGRLEIDKMDGCDYAMIWIFCMSRQTT